MEKGRPGSLPFKIKKGQPVVGPQSYFFFVAAFFLVAAFFGAAFLAAFLVAMWLILPLSIM
jgi:hypothetical protein